MPRVKSQERPAYGTKFKFSDEETATIEAARKLMERGLERGVALTDPSIAGSYIQARIGHLEHEVFMCLFLDTRHRVISFDEMSRGTLDGAEVHPREIAKRALQLNAAAVVLGHNHPSGTTEPSIGDRAVTQRLKQALALLDVRTLDHFVVGAGAEPCSMARLGLV